MVRPYSFTGTSAEPNTSTTPSTALAAEKSSSTSLAWGWSVNTTMAHRASEPMRSLP